MTAPENKIDVIKYEGDNNILVWRYPKQDFLFPSTLIVHESQEAIFFKNGQALDTFGPGDYQLKSENLPLLNKYVNRPTDGESPYHCEIYFINLVDAMFTWGTPSRMMLRDAVFNVLLPVGAKGQFTICVTDSRKLLTKLVGTINYFDRDTLWKYFRAILVKNIKTHISKQLVENKITLMEINNYLTSMSEAIKTQIAKEFVDYGLELKSFSIEDVNIPEDDQSYINLKRSLDEKAKMDIVGYTYQQERAYDVLGQAASNEGSGNGGLMNAGIGLGMGIPLGNTFGAAMANGMGGVLSPASQPLSQNILCPKCGTSLPSGAGFCYKCGAQLFNNTQKVENVNSVVCPNCKATVPNGAFCLKCGTRLKKVCPKCGTECLPDAVFCRICGSRIE